MRLKQLESALSSVQREFPNPNVTLEQYPTSPHLTAAVVLAALERNDVGPGRTVLDLGCGTAMLSIGCALVESDFVLGIDCDVSALEQATTNIRDIEVDDRVFLIRGTVDLPLESKRSGTYGSRGRGKSRQSSNKGGRINKTGGRNEHFAPGPSTCNSPDTDDMTTNNTNSRFPVLDNCIDTVVTNPPFGTKPDKAGIDVQFVKLGCRLARRAVYSFHKTSTRDFILRTMGDLPSVASVTVIAEMKFDLPQTYRFHQKASVDVAVDLIRVELIQEADKHDHDAHNTTSLNSEIGSDDGYADSEIDL